MVVCPGNVGKWITSTDAEISRHPCFSCMSKRSEGVNVAGGQKVLRSILLAQGIIQTTGMQQLSDQTLQIFVPACM